MLPALLSKFPISPLAYGSDLWRLVLVLGTTLAILFAGHVWQNASLRRKMPPGPHGLPLIGNSHQIPAVKPWRTFEKLNKVYGPVMSLFFGNTPIIVLGTAQSAWDLLEKRSEIYSSRPRFIMSGEILSENRRGLMLPYGESWRKWRKVLHSGFHARQSANYKDIQTLESKIAMQQIIDNPKDYEKHLQRLCFLKYPLLTYGRRVESVDEWIVKENMIAMDCKYIVESLPWLLKLPKPLQWFRREAEMQKTRDITLLMHLVGDVKQRMTAGTIPDCLTVQALENQEKEGIDDLFLAYTVSSPFGAGIETTAGTLCTFVLAMLHFPDVIRKAQAELDSVIGANRMPEFDDHDSLPYIGAVVRETLRWRPVAILGGTPHAVTADDEYKGMLIPKGSTIFANFAGIMNDSEMFPEPELFRPERFLETRDPRLTAFELPFGFGRRICPGMHLARNSLFINVARLLWAFDIVPALDKSGREIIPDSMNYTDGFNSRPVSFDARFIPRSEKVKNVIKSEYASAQERLGSWSW
ncbi:hypothetical protein EW145_g1830 [Phellinidium pouzarii]|uniref:Cytochrome P450 n=1 Tax=Phellinidium pouzarii TaxID=167371 RepID=A0A4S4LER6_9AGAM|nr:hypothetical protein EW145_g1830 [Phellinidium pouzarii]